MKHTLSLIVLCTLTAFTFAQELPKGKSWQILAHRGLSGLAPENTLISFKKAIEAGATCAECDVYRTADGVLVLSHDKNTKRTTGMDFDITKTNWEELQKLDAGSWK